LGQRAVDEKSNEITAIPELLKLLDLQGALVTIDAMGCQKRIAADIVAAGGDYVLAVKENQPRLREDIALVFAESKLPRDTITEAGTLDQHGGRIEERRLRASTALAGYTDWPGHRQVLGVERTITNKGTGETRTEVAYAITSLAAERASARQLLQLWRAHRHIENKLHRVRDVIFDEDRSQVRAGRIPQVMAALRNVAISLLRVCGAENIAAATRRYAARPALALAAVGLNLRE
jgi:predicted transposase YbfD/YdcC